VPAPASWALLIAGFGGVGEAIRSARREPAATPSLTDIEAA
jgi:hypothetical protein